MTPENFCYWLQGYFEIEEPDFLSKGQIRMIRDHLSLVFNYPKRERGQAKKKPRACAKPKRRPKKTSNSLVDWAEGRRSEVRYCASK